MAESALADASRFIVEGRKARVARAVRAVQDTVATRALPLIQEAIDATVPLPVDRGEYRRGWKIRRTKDGAEVFATTKQASIVEDGRRPGGPMPPIDPIKAWLLRKGLIKNRKGNAVRRVKAGSARDDEAHSAAFAIARAIAKRGIKGRKVFARAAKKLRAEVRAAVTKSMRFPF